MKFPLLEEIFSPCRFILGLLYNPFDIPLPWFPLPLLHKAILTPILLLIVPLSDASLKAQFRHTPRVFWFRELLLS